MTYSYLYTPVTGIVLLDTAMQGQWDAFWDAVSHVVLPACLLGYFSLAYISRMTRSFMLNELAQEYVIAARVKGLSEMRVIWRHALRNAAVPLITVIALSYANLLEGSVLTETVFAWPGLGQYITNSLQNADMNAVLGGTLVIGSRVRAAQSGVRLALPPARPEDALMAGSPPLPPIPATIPRPGLRAWLLSPEPASRWQARLGRGSIWAGAPSREIPWRCSAWR